MNRNSFIICKGTVFLKTKYVFNHNRLESSDKVLKMFILQNSRHTRIPHDNVVYKDCEIIILTCHAKNASKNRSHIQ